MNVLRKIGKLGLCKKVGLLQKAGFLKKSGLAEFSISGLGDILLLSGCFTAISWPAAVGARWWCCSLPSPQEGQIAAKP